MIMVDVYVPVINETYDFQLDENVETGKLITEMTGIISKKVKSEYDIDPEAFSLYSMDREEVIQRESTLYTAGIVDGSRLILV